MRATARGSGPVAASAGSPGRGDFPSSHGPTRKRGGLGEQSAAHGAGRGSWVVVRAAGVRVMKKVCFGALSNSSVSETFFPPGGSGVRELNDFSCGFSHQPLLQLQSWAVVSRQLF